MDDYRDVDELYTRSLEKIVLDAGLKLPSIWGLKMTPRQKELHDKRVAAARAGEKV